jgi:LuxR family transcriptional regulator
MVMNSTFTTISQSFLTDYERLDWFDDDVNMVRAMATEEPFFWDSARDRYSAPRTQSFTDYLHSKAMMIGLMAPLKRRASTASVLSLIAFNDRTFVRGTAEAANVIGNAALAKAEMLGLCDAISADEAAAARSLSQAQSEILNWIAEGKSNTDIGTIMDMSERTVRYHVSVILQKLGVASRAQAAAIRNARRIDPGG